MLSKTLCCCAAVVDLVVLLFMTYEWIWVSPCWCIRFVGCVSVSHSHHWRSATSVRMPRVNSWLSCWECFFSAAQGISEICLLVVEPAAHPPPPRIDMTADESVVGYFCLLFQGTFWRTMCSCSALLETEDYVPVRCFLLEKQLLRWEKWKAAIMLSPQ